MKELLRRLWRDFWYDPLVEYRHAKELLARRLASSEADDHQARRAKLRLWRSHPRPEDK